FRMLIVILLLIAMAVYYYGINRILGLPPGPHPLPLIGNMLSFQWNIDQVLLHWKARYGRIFTVWLPFPMVVIGDNKVLQEHVVKNGEVFMAKRNPEQLMDIVCGGEYGLVFENNDMVKEQRKFALKSLHEIGFGSAALEDTVHHYAQEIVTRWRKSGEEEVDVTENIMRAVGNIVWNITFGITLQFDNPMLIKFREIQQELLPRMAGPFMMFLETFPFLRHLDFFFGNKIKHIKELSDQQNEYLTEGIKTTERSFNPDNQPSCYVEAFLAEQKKREEAGKPLGNFHFKQLLFSTVSLWGAGFDTTVSILRICIIELVNYPDIQLKLQKEMDEVIGERRVRYDDQKLMPYMCAFLQETYRLSNVLPLNFLRQTTQNTEIEGHQIAEGTTILPQYSMVHSDPKEFETPDYFCPERHLNEEGGFVKDPRITPFSVGKRACLGETLARMEIFVMFTTFVQSCSFSPVGKVPPAIEFTTGFSRTVEDFVVKIQQRN
ncbi:hypothetical protein PENTCL1PPCAC_23658, partial [Pristionchus entomophagus]